MEDSPIVARVSTPATHLQITVCVGITVREVDRIVVVVKLNGESQRIAGIIIVLFVVCVSCAVWMGVEDKYIN